QSTTEAREENGNAVAECCTWAPKGNVAKVGLGCLLVSTLPFLAYSIVCLNPMKSDFNNVSYIVVPVIISRLCPLLNPLLYIWYAILFLTICFLQTRLASGIALLSVGQVHGCQSQTLPEQHIFIAKRMRENVGPPPKTYHTINLIAEVPGMSFPILTPTEKFARNDYRENLNRYLRAGIVFD
ncbi:hypothetical protein OSTOST_18827, partial [Ostertagia ostertagi]